MNVDPLREEHNRLRAEARASRREFSKNPVSRFAREMWDAITGYLGMRKDGVSREDACRGLEEVLRGLLKVTKFPSACDTCDDTGWQERRCTHQMRCTRKWCAMQHPAHEHTFVVPCHCPAGDSKRKRERQVDDELAAASRVQKRKSRGFSHVGG